MCDRLFEHAAWEEEEEDIVEMELGGHLRERCRCGVVAVLAILFQSVRSGSDRDAKGHRQRGTQGDSKGKVICCF